MDISNPATRYNQISMGSDSSSKYPLLARALIVGAWAWFAVALVFYTDGNCYFFGDFVFAGGGLALGLGWIVGTSIGPDLLRRFAWLSVPASGLLGCTLLLTGWGMALRLALCEDDLRARAESALAAWAPESTPSQVGLFEVKQIWTYNGGVYLVTGSCWMDENGIAYFPSGAPPAQSKTSYRRLFGPWYKFTSRF
jgi:hypothetical protein